MNCTDTPIIETKIRKDSTRLGKSARYIVVANIGLAVGQTVCCNDYHSAVTVVCRYSVSPYICQINILILSQTEQS